jgi:hypothetical protein
MLSVVHLLSPDTLAAEILSIQEENALAPAALGFLDHGQQH